MINGEAIAPIPVARNDQGKAPVIVECDWKRAHTELVRLAADQARLDWEVGSWLLKAVRSGTPLRLGYGSITEYANRLFGYEARFTNERLRVAEALEELPELSRALREGRSSWSVARELTRVATPETEAEWMAVAQGRTSREVERLVSGRRPGDRPDDPAEAALLRHVLRFEVRAETRALVREALAKLRREAGGRLDDDAALLLMARQVLGGPEDPGRSSYQLAVTRCGDCQRANVHASGDRVEVGPEVLEMIECDAQRIGSVEPESAVPEGTPTHAGNGAGSDPSPPQPDRRERATQSIPPAVRRKIVHRDGGRCKVPGCRHSHFLDIHHIEPRADGGDHNPDLLILLCGVHHAAAHRGELIVSGRVSAGLKFQHADGTEYGGLVAPRAADVRTKAFQALRGLGFRETQVKRALEQVMTHAGNAPEIGEILRKSLAVLTP